MNCLKFLKILENKFLMFLFSVSFLILNSQLIRAESIKNYDVEILVNRNGTLTVNEKIGYKFDTGFKHGIYRDIPLRSQKDGIDIYKSYVKMNSVTRNGIPEEYTTRNFHEGIRYRIGSADRYVDAGVNNYELNYTIYNAVFEKDGVYQIYYNVIGQFWGVPIEKADVVLKFSDGQPIEKDEIEKLEIYTGEFGETGNNYIMTDNDGEIGISTKEQLAPYNGISFLINLKTDKINPSIIDKVKTLYYADPLIVISPLIILGLLIYSFITWTLFGKDPNKKAIIPEFNIPQDISPIYAAYINGSREPKELLTVGAFSLLSKDYIKAEDEAGNGKNVKYTLNSTQTGNERLFEEENKLLSALSNNKSNIFGDGDKLYSAANSILTLMGDKYSDKVYKGNTGFLIPFIIAIIMIFFVSGNNTGFNDIGTN